MNQQSTFVDHTPESAPERARPLLAGVKKKFGYLPSPLARLAESPAVIEAFNYLSLAFEKSALSALGREVVILTVARENECEYCVAMHSAMLSASDDGRAVLGALRAGSALEDAKLEALRLFTKSVLAERGDASEAARAAFFEAGYTRSQALDVILGVAAYTLSTYGNRLTRAPLDEALEAHRWQKRGA